MVSSGTARTNHGTAALIVNTIFHSTNVTQAKIATKLST